MSKAILSATITLAVGTLFIAGCDVPGYMAYAVGAGATMPAKYVPKKEPTLVLVENDRAAAAAYADCDHVSRYIEQDLKEHDVGPLVSPNVLVDLRDRDPIAYRAMTIVEIAKATGAKQVIYVTLSDYDSDTAEGSVEIQWKAQAKVRVVDAQTGLNRWPPEFAEGQPLKAHTQMTYVDPDGKNWDAHDDLDKDIALQVGELFHPWVQEDQEEEELRRN